ncbi:Crp/Fnr family transcriptional regulator [Aliiroseovarius sp.]|uniref:Crp/Fnr family transcriptional regulator n=1 Tax=Aliiroseovarius sp. TaxID=1872442 RepID=UPI00260586E9|nr:Crp/Fnr family transcriptional regulator [Aliiroseovarius sp.]
MSWTKDTQEIAGLDAPARTLLDRLAPMDVPGGAVLFSPGDAVKGYVVVLSGRVDVHLIGPNGRDILLYQVAPGQSCIQSTLGLLGGEEYTGEATAAGPARLVLIPRDLFLALVDSSPGFRRMVFGAFAARMQDMMQLVENMSFMKVEARLAGLVLDRARAGTLHMTQADMATAIGSAREVVSRRLDRWARAGLVLHGRAEVTVLDRAGLEEVRKSPAL